MHSKRLFSTIRDSFHMSFINTVMHLCCVFAKLTIEYFMQIFINSHKKAIKNHIEFSSLCIEIGIQNGNFCYTFYFSCRCKYFPLFPYFGMQICRFVMPCQHQKATLNPSFSIQNVIMAAKRGNCHAKIDFRLLQNKFI